MASHKVREKKDDFAILEILRTKGVSVPPFTTDLRDIGEVGLPAYVISRGGNGPDVRTAVARYGDIAPAIARAMRSGASVAVQKCVPGHEVARGVMEHEGKTVPLMPIDALPRPRHEAVSWHMAERQIARVQKLAAKAHEACGALGHSCVRLVASPHGEYVTSVEFAPALTRSAAFVHSAAVVGFTLPELVRSLEAKEARS